MKMICTLLFAAFAGSMVCAQENENTSSAYQQQLEQQAAQEENETEDDSYLQYLEQRRKHRLHLNRAGEEELRELNLLSDLQIQNLLRYRQLFGNLVNLYEMQAIPAWDLNTIRSLLPFVTLQSMVEIPANWRSWFSKGESKWLFRFSQVLEKAKGFLKTDSGSHYPGSPSKMLFRYKYQFRDQLQYGITGDKDAGEQFLKGKQKAGFDFYSFHFFLRRLGMIKALALGDFIINLGQGLIHWQGQAFKKSSAVLNIKRQGAVLKPYTAAGEYNFHRGAAISLQFKKWQSAVFVSARKWDAALQSGEYVSSVQSSGFHRTNTELGNKNRVKAFIAGANLQRRHSHGHTGFNAVYYSFSIPFRPSDDPYDWYAINGKNWYNASFDYSYTWSNCHLYGEIAADKNFNTAFLQGLLISADPLLDISMVYRRISPAYQAIAANAFTEGAQPSNENGLYTGLSFRPAYGFRIDAYADFFQFPWLRYRVDAPSTGCDYLLQITWTPNKQSELYTRVRIESKAQNQPAGDFAMPVAEQVLRKNWRSQVSYQVNKEWSLQNRVEVLWYETNYTHAKKTGFLCFQDIQYRPAAKSWKWSIRFQYFEAGDYDTRLYAFENSVMYSLSMPAFFNKGFRLNFVFQHKTKFHKSLSCTIGLQLAQSIYATGTAIGSGQDELPGSRKTEFRLQAILSH